MVVKDMLSPTRQESPMHSPQSQTRHQSRLIVMDIAAQVLLAFAIGLTMSLVLAAMVLLLSQPS
jgi:hypothetical protein